MADLGLQNAFGGEAMAQQVRQRILDQLAATQQQHQQSVEDQKLEIERQRFAQEAQDRALLRQQQATTFNEAVGEKAGANAGPGQTVMSPAEAAPILGAPSMRGLIKPDQTLPSTQITGSGQAPTTEVTPGTQVAGTRPTITQQPSVLTGQLRFMGTPKANAEEAAKVRASQFVAGLAPNSVERRTAEYEQAFPGRNPPNFDKTTTEPLEQVIGPDGKPTFAPRSKAVGMTPYHVPPQPQTVVMPTVNAAGEDVTRIVPKVAGSEFAARKTGTSQTKAEDRQHALASLDQLDQAVEGAKDLIGPGAGRISTIEQAIGNPDPRIATLGTKLLLAKMQVDAGIGGARAAASPQLLARWDNLLTQKLTPEALHATVQAMRDILSEGTKPAGATVPSGPQQPTAPRVYYDAQGNRR